MEFSHTQYNDEIVKIGTNHIVLKSFVNSYYPIVGNIEYIYYYINTKETKNAGNNISRSEETI
jgi:hypothetical protein